MARSSLSKYLSLINHQVTSQEHLSTFLAEAIAMLNVALTGHFTVFDAPTVHYYLLAMDDIVTRTRDFNEQLLVNWNKIIKRLEEPDESKEPQGSSGSETIH